MSVVQRAKDFVERWVAKNRISEPLRREKELNHLKSLPAVPWDPKRPTGVLLADEIELYAHRFKLIEPFHIEDPRNRGKKKLRAAGYELSVGEVFSKGGKVQYLKDEVGKDKIVVNPFEVVIIQTLERLNMPEFMIARWNVAVGQAYRGLLWVGAAQVDPGFKGYLCCPIYNLSDKPCTLKYGESIAVIDFVTTTPPTHRSEQFKFDALGRKRVLFEDYDLLKSALANSQERLNQADKEIADLRGTVAVSNGVILTAIGVVVTALALFVSKDYPEFLTRFSPSLWISLAALVVSFLGVILAITKNGWKRHLLCIALVVATGGFLYWYAGKYPLSSSQPPHTPQTARVPTESRPEVKGDAGEGAASVSTGVSTNQKQ
jgi:deoxycytidine triphosphate deaminase